MRGSGEAVATRRVIIGGTFGFLHAGHKALLKRAFSIGDSVYIGLTTDGYVKRKKHSAMIPGYSERRKTLEAYVRRFGKRYVIRKLDDSRGPAARGRFDVIVVSDETEKVAREINSERMEAGLRPLEIIVVRRVRRHGRIISTYRIIEEMLNGSAIRSNKKLETE